MPRLKPGDKAPVFNHLNYDGNLISLSQFTGKKVWLAFYRYSSCPLCLDHFAEVLERHAELRSSNGEFIAVFESKSIDLRKNPCRKMNVFYPMLADSEKKIYSAYGVEENFFKALHPSVLFKLGIAMAHGFPQGKIDGAIGRVPAHFLIRPDGIIDTAHYGSHIADNIPWWKVARFMGKTQTGQVNPNDPWARFHYR